MSLKTEQMCLVSFTLIHRNCCSFSSRIICPDTNSKCLFIHQHLNNAWYNKSHWLTGRPYLAIIVGDVIGLMTYSMVDRCLCILQYSISSVERKNLKHIRTGSLEILVQLLHWQKTRESIPHKDIVTLYGLLIKTFLFCLFEILFCFDVTQTLVHETTKVIIHRCKFLVVNFQL